LGIFVASSHIAVDSSNNPQSMRDTPSSVAKTTTYVHQIYVKKREKETEEPAVSQQAKKKGKNL
jgi:transglutaminase/protease-like cytokinesis protein 3